MKLYLGIDIGGTYIKYGTYTYDGVEVSSSKVRTKMGSLDEFVDLVVSIINSIDNVEGIGVSIPGFVDIKSGLIIDPGAIEPLRGQNLKELIYKKCGRNVDLENDANCVVLAEKWKGNGKDYDNFIAITLGTGIGGGIMINNQLYRGNKFMAGEFGYMIVNGIKDNKPKESTGSLIASTISLVKMIARKKGINHEDLSGEEIFNMIDQHDNEVIDIYNTWIESVSLIIYNLVFALNPDAILIGGGISSQPRVLEDIKTKVEQLDSRTTNLVDINICKFSNDSGKIGAVYSYLTNKI